MSGGTESFLIPQIYLILLELPKKLNVAASQSIETIPNEDFHFYRFYIEENDIVNTAVLEKNITLDAKKIGMDNLVQSNRSD